MALIGTMALGMLMPCAWARQFYSIQVTTNLYYQDTETRSPKLVGGPLNLFYVFSDDGVIVNENNERQRGVWISLQDSKMTIAFEPTALSSLIERLLYENPVIPLNERTEHLGLLQNLFALSIFRIRPMEFAFNKSTPEQSAVYQFHSPFHGEESKSYHLIVKTTRPLVGRN
jgi:hypothetical protein